MEEGSSWGARIERGRVTAIDGSGQTDRFTIQSYDRPGVTASRIADPTNLQPEIGEKVCFFMFDDGTGCIVGTLD